MSPDSESTRRTFLRTAGALGVGTLLAGCQGSASEAPTTDDPSGSTDPTTNGTTTRTTNEPTDGEEPERLSGRGKTRLVRVGPDGDNRFAPAVVTVDPGTTVRFVWKSDDHNVSVTDAPADADWHGHEALADAGFEYEHVFDTPGRHAYACTPHEALGMRGVVHVRGYGPGPVTTSPVETNRIAVGADDDLVFTPGTERPAKVGVGEELTFAWESAGHNLVVTHQPDGANWQGHEPIEDEGFETTATFDVPGRYEFACQPHRTLGMTGTLLVEK